MKRILTLLLAAGAMASASAQVGVSIGINQPGIYGRVNIGVPAPALVLPTPVIISPPRIAVSRAPIYLYVPPEHQLHWARYCGRYNACGQPVYFVREDWVRDRYTHEHPGWDRDHRGPGWHGDRRDDHRDDHRDDRRDGRRDDHRN